MRFSDECKKDCKNNNLTLKLALVIGIIVILRKIHA